MKRLALPLLVPLLCGWIWVQPSRFTAPATGIVLDVASEGHLTTGNHTIAHNQGNLTNGEVTIFVNIYKGAGAPTVATLSYGGIDLLVTPTNAVGLVDTVLASGNNARSYIYKLDLGTSAAGTKTVLCTFSAAPVRSEVVVVTHSGVKQNTAFTHANHAATSGTQTVTVATTSSLELVVAGISSTALNTITEAQTLYYEYQSGDACQSTQRTPGTGGSVVMTWTASTVPYAATAEVLQPAP